ncbi:MAG TPA: TolC family protein, partial [Polyangiaceae bacterium]|nr:TolC family protein [Polyangiaceae bacterium]
MKLRPLAALWLVGALATGAARAETLTIEDATRLAQERSPRRQEAQALVEGARAAVSVARSGYLPDANLAAVATAGFGGSTQQLGVRGIINSPYTQHFGAGIEAGWTVYDFGRTSSRVDAALARVDSATAWKGLTGRAAAHRRPLRRRPGP